MDIVHPHELISEDVEDDDMPPLIDKPNPSSNYTFLFDTASPSPANADSSQVIPSTIAIASSPSNTSTTESIATTTLNSPSSPTSPESSQLMPSTSTGRPRSKSTRGAQGRKREASHIPRPPNAFILFRSSFIRSQRIPDKVEGNHSNLSKIIGHYWKALSSEERAEWEAKAVIAQEKHRQEYPDWRFRPGPYAMGKPKAKDNGTATTSRRRSTISKTPDAPSAGEGADEKRSEEVTNKSSKSKGKEKETARAVEDDDTRWVKIANLLKEGKKGPQLTLAVEEWEDMKRNATSVDMKSSATEDRTRLTPQSPDVSSKASSPDRQSSESHSAAERSPDLSHASTSSQSPSNAISMDSTEFPASPVIHAPKPPRRTPTVPLTHMFTCSPHSSTSPSNVSPSIADICPPTQFGLELAPISPNTPVQASYAKEAPLSSPSVYGFPQRSDWRPEESVSSYGSQAPPPRGESYWQWDPQTSLDHSEASEKRHQDPISQREMGYDRDTTVMEYDPYGKNFDLSDLPRDGSEVTTWATSSNRHGLTSVMDDPLDNPPSTIPGTFPLANNIDPSSHPTDPQSMAPPYFYQPLPPSVPVSTSMSNTSTSFSTLAGWAGEYSFHRDSHLRSQLMGTESSDHDTSPKFPNSSTWYPQHMQWSAPSHEDHGMGMVLSSDDWDHVDDLDPRTSS